MTYLTTRQVADFLCVNYRYVQYLIRTGRLPCERRRFGRRTTYFPTTEELRDYLSVYEPAMLKKHDAEFHVDRLGRTS